MFTSSYISIRGPVPIPVLVSVALQFPATVHLKKVSVSIISCISLGPYLILCLSPSPDLIISSSHYPRLISNFCVNSYLSVKSESHSLSKPSPSSLNPSNIPSDLHSLALSYPWTQSQFHIDYQHLF